MRLLNYTTTYFAGLLLIIISIWAIIFYYDMLGEIYDGINDGLENQKQLIIQKAQTDSSVLNRESFAESNYKLHEISIDSAKLFKDVYTDTMIYLKSEAEFQPVRTLKTAFLLNNRYYQLNVSTSTVEEDDIVEELLFTLLWLYAGLVVSILLLNNFLLKKVWRPFYFLLKGVEKFSLDNPKPLPDLKTGIYEFTLLSNTIQKMIALNVDIYNSQKQFIENASHEMQTPLAISINKLETLAEIDGLPEEGISLLTGAINNLERLTRLNKSLLLLSKISNRQFDEVTNVNINELVQKAIQDFGDQLKFSNVKITFKQQNVCILKINSGLLSILVNNLIKNAIVHNIDGGSVDITINKKILRIENTGKNISLNEEKMFSRFYKETQSATSTGLGLAIVKAIADLYNFSAVYTYDKKHIITINFNNAQQ